MSPKCYNKIKTKKHRATGYNNTLVKLGDSVFSFILLLMSFAVKGYTLTMRKLWRILPDTLSVHPFHRSG